MSGELIITFDDGAKHENVSVAGEFTGWNPSHMQLVSGTKFSASFSNNIHAGHDYMYKFVVDGEWKLLEGHTTRTDLEGNVNHVATATIVESDKTPAAAHTPGVVPVAIHREGAEHRSLSEMKAHDRQRAQYLAQQIESAEHREKQKDSEEIAKDRAHLGSVQAGATTHIDNAGGFTEAPSTPSKERKDDSVRDIFEESDIPPATDPDSTIGSAYTPDKSWSSPARANAEVVGPSGVSTPPRVSDKDNGSISDLSAPATPTTKAAKVPASKPTDPPSQVTESAAQATESTGQAGESAGESAGQTTESAAKATTSTDKPVNTDSAKKQEKEKPKRGSLRKFFRKFMD